jgi:hypothetical protein
MSYKTEAETVAASLPDQWDLRLSGDWQGESALMKGQSLFDLIAPDGSRRGQILLECDSDY